MLRDRFVCGLKIIQKLLLTERDLRTGDRLPFLWVNLKLFVIIHFWISSLCIYMGDNLSLQGMQKTKLLHLAQARKRAHLIQPLSGAVKQVFSSSKKVLEELLDSHSHIGILSAVTDFLILAPAQALRMKGSIYADDSPLVWLLQSLSGNLHATVAERGSWWVRVY